MVETWWKLIPGAIPTLLNSSWAKTSKNHKKWSGQHFPWQTSLTKSSPLGKKTTPKHNPQENTPWERPPANGKVRKSEITRSRAGLPTTFFGHVFHAKMMPRLVGSVFYRQNIPKGQKRAKNFENPEESDFPGQFP